jgi:hypothetical protein
LGWEVRDDPGAVDEVAGETEEGAEEGVEEETVEQIMSVYRLPGWVTWRREACMSGSKLTFGDRRWKLAPLRYSQCH